jgi:DNA-binding MarR family transcriptional regulator
MNYSDIEVYANQIDDEALIEAGLRLLPVIGKTLYAAISGLGQVYHLTPTQVKVLLHLGTIRQMTVGEIAGALGISMPAASELVDRLVEAGHLVRTIDPADRRRALIAATPESQKISAQLRDLRRAQLRHALAALPQEERPIFIRSLEALVAALTHCSGFDLPGKSAGEIDEVSMPPDATREGSPSLLAPTARGNDG